MNDPHRSFVRVQNLCIARGGRIILDNVSFSITTGECVALVGPNGVGKTSLLLALLGLLPIRSGSIFLQNRPLQSLNRRAAAREIAYVPQIYEGFTGFTVHDLVAASRYARRGPFTLHSREDQRIITAALQTTGLLELREQLVCRLSGGERQKVFLAAALAQQSTAFFLDEPTAALDPQHQQQLLALLQQQHAQGRTILLISHDLNLAVALQARILAFGEGRLLYDQPVRDFIDSNHPSRVFQAAFTRLYTPEGQARVLLHV